MSIYSKVDSGVTRYRTMLPSRDRWCGTVDFFRLYGAQTKFLIPGDIWKESVHAFIRLNPMLTPSLTPMSAKIRWFYVPLRLVEPDLTELIITGSKDGKLSEESLPEFPSLLSEWDYNGLDEIHVYRDSIAHVIFQVQNADFSNGDNLNEKHYPRLYWLKAYCRIWWDYYRDENLELTLVTYAIFGEDNDEPVTFQIDNSDFDSFFDFVAKYSWCLRCLPICLPKDYFTSSLPWQLKGVAPTVQFTVTSDDFSLQQTWQGGSGYNGNTQASIVGFSGNTPNGVHGLFANNDNSLNDDKINQHVQSFLDNIQNTITGQGSTSLSFDASDMRDMFAETRVFERLARTGSRYIEYLRANFGTAPSDGTLQRAQYLGGFSQEILTTEVLQTGVGDTPVGTMRGHGISSASNSMEPFYNKEFGMLFCTFEVKPRVQYTQGIDRQLTYASRFEFFNPSFQNLSEQEVRNGEIYSVVERTGTYNTQTFGFQGMYNELRSGRERMFGEFIPTGTQAQWSQAIDLKFKPSLNGAFINGVNYASSWLRPFGLSEESETTKPIIIDLYNVNTPLRPMIRNPTPGLIDHN